MICYLDFDDFNSENYNADIAKALDELVAYFDDFKCNMFVSAGLGQIENPYPERIAYCLHGDHHIQGEEMSEEKISAWPHDKVYRAHFWVLSDQMYGRLRKMGFKIMLNYFDVDEQRKGIFFDWNIKDAPDLQKTVLFGHGHVMNGANGICEMIENIKKLPKDTQFNFLRNYHA